MWQQQPSSESSEQDLQHHTALTSLQPRAAPPHTNTAGGLRSASWRQTAAAAEKRLRGGFVCLLFGWFLCLSQSLRRLSKQRLKSTLCFVPIKRFLLADSTVCLLFVSPPTCKAQGRLMCQQQASEYPRVQTTKAANEAQSISSLYNKGEYRSLLDTLNTE